MKTIWIINYYAMPPEYDVWGRHFEFAKNFIKEGYKVRVFTSGFIYGYGIDLVPDGQKYLDTAYSGVPYTLIKVPGYKGNGIQRMKSIALFAYRIKKMRSMWETPDVIYHNQRAPFDYAITNMAKKMKVRYICEAWDLWPHVFVTGGLVSANNPLMKAAYRIERKMYECASDVIFTFPGGIDYLRMHGWTTETPSGTINPKKVHYINNGIRLGDFYENIKLHPTRDADLERTDKFKVIYLGSISLSNNVKQLIDAAAILKDDSRFIFLLYGNGNEKEALMQYVKDNHIDNVIFKSDRIPYHDCAYIVSQASLNVMNYKRGFAKWGLSNGKMFQYMAAGRPMLSNDKISYSQLEEYHCGIDKNLDTPQDYADAIRYFADLTKEEYDKMCENAKEAAKHFDYEFLSKQMLRVIEKLA